MTKLKMMTGLAAAGLLAACVSSTTSVDDSASAAPSTTEVSAQADTSSFGSALNSYRSSKGLAPMARNATLEKAASAHLRDMRAKNYFSHTGKDGSSVGDRLRRAGCSNALYVSENLGSGHRSVSQVMSGWKGSKGHNANLLRETSRLYGLANSGDLWVLVMAQSC